MTSYVKNQFTPNFQLSQNTRIVSRGHEELRARKGKEYSNTFAYTINMEEKFYLI